MDVQEMQMAVSPKLMIKKDFLHIADSSSEELQDLLDLAMALKKEYFNGGNAPVLKGKALAMVFQKPSLDSANANQLRMWRACYRVMCRESWRASFRMSI